MGIIQVHDKLCDILLRYQLGKADPPVNIENTIERVRTQPAQRLRALLQEYHIYPGRPTFNKGPETTSISYLYAGKAYDDSPYKGFDRVKPQNLLMEVTIWTKEYDEALRTDEELYELFVANPQSILDPDMNLTLTGYLAGEFDNEPVYRYARTIKMALI